MGRKVAMLTMQDIADRLGVARESVRRYRTRGELPPADQMVGRTPVWRPATVDRWVASRPGRGRRRQVQRTAGQKSRQPHREQSSPER